ncbi:hypothetical protein ABIB57_001230 [Devosia sp. UYZn731]|uniref:hypothetical protein n=1 Tax=Devosia sp. UYZn731 TaxID=3156345 RepID=UPI003397E54A
MGVSANSAPIHPPTGTPPQTPPGAPAILTKILAATHILVGLACSAIAIPFIGLFLSDPGANPGYRADGGFFLLLFAVYFAPSVIGGLGLLFNARWARLLLQVQAFAYLFLIPLGSILGIVTLVVLLGGQMPSNATMDQSGDPLPTPGALHRVLNHPLGSLGSVIAAMAIVGPGFIIAIALLYHLNEPRTPPYLDQAAIIALPILLVAMVVLIRSILMADGTTAPNWAGIDFFHARKRRWARESRLLTQAEHQRVKRLAADPALRKYADLIAHGQHWSDAQIAYDRDPTRLLTCTHIQPIERAMRDAGILVRPLHGALVNAACCVDGTRLQTQFSIQLPVWFNDDIPGDRPYDPEGAAIMCREHGSGIWLLHPRDAKPATPVFPN